MTSIKDFLKAPTLVKELTASNTEWLNKYALVEKDLKEAQDTIGNFMAEKETFNKQLETLKAEYEAKISTMVSEHTANVAELTAKVEDTKTSVVSEVTKKMASIGIPEGLVKEDKPVDVMNHYKTWMSLTNNKEKQEYYNKHSKDILNNN